MGSKKKNIIVLAVLLVVLVLVIIFICIDFMGGKGSSDSLLINEQGTVNNKKELDDSYTDTDLSQDKIVEDRIDIVIDDNNDAYNEEDVISYFENMENDTLKSDSFKEKFKEYFITIVDFIFYDKEIKGYTFDELSGTAKAKIISVALKIDSKIEEYVPNYKENISNTSSKIYTDVKEKMVTMYFDISTDICKNNEEQCDKVKEIFGGIKDTCKIGWEFIKGLFSGGITKVREWYEIYSGK